MATSKTWNNTSFPIPDNGDSRGTWGANLSTFLKALADNALSKYGGSFQLTGADIDFGSSYGLIATYVKSKSANIAQSGVIRLANNEGIGFRNTTNGADKIFKLGSDDKWNFGTSALSEAELSYLSGVTSAIQTQLDAKATSSALSAHESDTSTHGVTGDIVGTTDTQTLSSKTLDAPVIDNAVTFVQETTPSNPSSGRMKFYPKSDGFFYTLDENGVEVQVGSGSGQGEKNYITNPSAAVSIAGWAISGAGTLARTTTGSVLPREYTTGTAFQFTSSTNGEFVYNRFILDDVDIGRRIQNLIDYISSSSNFRVEVYKNPDGAWGEDTSEEVPLLTDVSGDSYLAAAPDSESFLTQFDTDDKIYMELRIVHNGTGTDTIYFSDVLVGPGTLVQGPIVGKPQDFSASGQGFGVFGSSHLQYRQVGSFMHISGRFTSGSPTATEARLNLPFGTVGKWANGAITCVVGKWARNNAGASIRKQGLVLATSGHTYITFGFDDYTSAINPVVNQNGDNLCSAGEILFFDGEIVIPIAEWANSASVNLLNQNTQSPIKAGTVQAWAGATVPTGWLECDGSAYAQTTYPQLYAALGSTWATCARQDGTGGNYSAPTAGNFRVPDLRGVFLRGVGTSSDSAGNGDVTVTLAGFQDDTFKAHSHAQTGGTSAGAFNTFAWSSYSPQTMNTNTQDTGGTETRPRNVGVKYIIKAWDESFNLAGFAEATADRMGMVQGGKVPGSTSGSAIASGFVGEVLSATKLRSAASSISNTIAANVTASPLVLTEGVWEVSGMVGYDPVTTLTSTSFYACISKTSGTFSAADTLGVPNSDGEVRAQILGNAGDNDVTVSIPPVRVYVPSESTVSYYLIGRADFSAGTCNVYGSLRAVRIA
jgi:microcystin-dependent protein